MKFLKSKIFITLIVLLVIAAIGYYTYDNYFSAKGQSKRFAIAYLEAEKNGEEVVKFLDESEHGFIQLFDYDFLREVTTVREMKTESFDFDRWYSEAIGDENYPLNTYQDYKKHYSKKYNEETGYQVIFDDDYNYEVWNGKEYKDIQTFMFDVSIANALGDKKHKRISIVVENDDEIGRKITNVISN